MFNLSFSCHYFPLYELKIFFLHQRLIVAVHWSLCISKSSPVSRTLPSILADLNDALVWMVSILPLISISFSVLSKTLKTVPSAPTNN